MFVVNLKLVMIDMLDYKSEVKLVPGGGISFGKDDKVGVNVIIDDSVDSFFDRGVGAEVCRIVNSWAKMSKVEYV